jgi:hypothetical protein
MSDAVQLRNRKLAEELLEEVRRNPQAQYAGKFVGIANGQVAVIADDWDQLARRLRQAEPDPSKTFSVEMRRDYSTMQEIWGLTSESIHVWQLRRSRPIWVGGLS